MNWIKLLGWYGLSIPILFFAGDFLLTRYILDVDADVNFNFNPEKQYRIQHHYYSHTLLENYDGYGRWGKEKYRVCTDSLGMKTSCNRSDGINKHYDIAFIGDSFTEAIGVPYEKSFVGMYAQHNRDIRIANLGVASYSPGIYLKKTEWFLNKGIHFDHMMVFIDISDIQDEAATYKELDNGSIIKSRMAIVKDFVKKHFYLFTTAYKGLKKLIRPPPPEVPKQEGVFDLPRSRWTYDSQSEGYGELGVQGGIDKALDYMDRLHDLLERHGIRLSVGVYPWPAQLKELENSPAVNLQSRIWQEFCLDKCEYFIDLFPKFAELVANKGAESVYHDYYIAGDVHFNEKGNALIFTALRETFDNP